MRTCRTSQLAHFFGLVGELSHKLTKMKAMARTTAKRVLCLLMLYTCMQNKMLLWALQQAIGLICGFQEIDGWMRNVQQSTDSWHFAYYLASVGQKSHHKSRRAPARIEIMLPFSQDQFEMHAKHKQWPQWALSLKQPQAKCKMCKLRSGGVSLCKLFRIPFHCSAGQFIPANGIRNSKNKPEKHSAKTVQPTSHYGHLPVQIMVDTARARFKTHNKHTRREYVCINRKHYDAKPIEMRQKIACITLKA